MKKSIRMMIPFAVGILLASCGGKNDSSNVSSTSTKDPISSKTDVSSKSSTSSSSGSLSTSVPKAAVESVVLASEGGKTSIKENETLKLTATVLPENAEDKSLNWTSSDDSVATVDETGTVTAHSAGTVTIEATSANGKKGEFNLTVEALIQYEMVKEAKDLKAGNTVVFAGKYKNEYYPLIATVKSTYYIMTNQ